MLIRRRNRTLSPAAERVWKLVLEMRGQLQALAQGAGQAGQL
ncbi:LysR family transcriptional regulator [Chromobacterium vaccinii]|nr:LysR family transcriptional regulator [Chromobacterium vaccinii]QND89530.1 LysR family transcriptional regulator [Chromobacterium vaccinii]